MTTKTTNKSWRDAGNGRLPEERMYPLDCTSAYCGRTACGGCERLPALEEFKAWRTATKATRPSWIWSPHTWVETLAQPTISDRTLILQDSQHKHPET
jgi:hypothetical protein